MVEGQIHQSVSQYHVGFWTSWMSWLEDVSNKDGDTGLLAACYTENIEHVEYLKADYPVKGHREKKTHPSCFVQGFSTPL